MDGTITWMLVLAGATVTLLGAFLVVSEKELRKKRREAASLAAKLSRSSTSVVANDYQKIETANKELQEQLSVLSSISTTKRQPCGISCIPYRKPTRNITSRERPSMSSLRR